MRTTRTRQHGFTVIEVSVVITVMALALTLFTSNFVRAQDFAEHERARMRNLVEQQESLRNLEAILQAVDATTLSGFDDSGVATTPTFRRWLHDPADGATLSPAQRIEWRAGGEQVTDVKAPGRLVLVTGTDVATLVDRVPRDGFRVRLDGRRLFLRLETFYPTASKETVRTTTKTAVFIGRGDD